MADKIIPLAGAQKDPITGMLIGEPGLEKARGRVVRDFNRWLRTKKKITEAPTDPDRIAGLFDEFIEMRAEIEAPRLQKMRKQKTAASKMRGG